MPTHLSGHQLAAIMFTDVVGYTAMREQHESKQTWETRKKQ